MAKLIVGETTFINVDDVSVATKVYVYLLQKMFPFCNIGFWM
jgi:hypothetical protein